MDGRNSEICDDTRLPNVRERLLSFVLGLLPIKHGKHRLLDLIS
jgi:hypothetical protein